MFDAAQEQAAAGGGLFGCELAFGTPQEIRSLGLCNFHRMIDSDAVYGSWQIIFLMDGSDLFDPAMHSLGVPYYKRRCIP